MRRALGDRGARAVDQMARMAARTRHRSRGAAARRARVSSDDRGERVRQSDRRTDAARTAEGVARSRGIGAGPPRRCPLAQTVLTQRTQRTPRTQRFRTMARLSLAEAEQRIKGLKGWNLEGDQIRKQFAFADF